MTALKYPMALNQGETSSLVFPILDEFGSPVTVTGWTGKAQIRAKPGGPAVLYEWSTAHSNITVTGTTVTLRVPAVDSAGWSWLCGFYDLILTDLSGNVYRIAEGPVRIDPSTTL